MAKLSSVELRLAPAFSLRDDTAPVLGRPGWVSVDTRGRFLVADKSDKDIKAYDPQGTRSATLGGAGHGASRFQALLSAAAFRDSVVAGDFISQRLEILTLDGRFVRSVALPAKWKPHLMDVRVVDDSLLLLVGSPIGADSKELLALVRPDGRAISLMYNRDSYFEGNPFLIQSSPTMADARAGCLFASSSFADSVFAYSYTGQLIGGGALDDSRQAVSLRRRLEEVGGGSLARPSGNSVFDGTPLVSEVVALDGCRVAVFMPDRHGVDFDHFAGGAILIMGMAPGGHLEIVGRTRVPGGLAGRDGRGNPLVLQYATGNKARGYEMVRVTLQ